MTRQRKLARVRRWKTRAETRRLVWERDGGRCRYCGAPGQELDHVRRRRGRAFHHPNNLVCACRTCNRRKWKHTGFVLWKGVVLWWMCPGIGVFYIHPGAEAYGDQLWPMVKDAYAHTKSAN